VIPIATDSPLGRGLLRLFGVLTSVACLVVVVAGVQRIDGNDPSGSPDRVHFENRDYNRGREEVLPDDAIESGRTSTGELVFKPAGEVGLSVVIWVSDHDHTRAYALVGGP
jgi:hypothetical protein